MRGHRDFISGDLAGDNWGGGGSGEGERRAGGTRKPGWYPHLVEGHEE